MLMMLQNAKNAALMRMLGMARRRIGLVLSAGLLLPCIIALTGGMIFTILSGWAVSAGQSLMFASQFLAGALMGCCTGAIVILRRPPLELLQVKE
jgi:hypothetical protein